MICCVSRAKMYIWSRKIDESSGFGVFFLIFSFSQFWMILRCCDSEFRLCGLISCPGLLLNWSGLEFSSFSDFSVHMVSMCLFCKSKSSSANASWDLGPGPNWSLYILVSMSEATLIFKWSAAEREAKHYQRWQILLAETGLGAGGGCLILAAQGRRITL